MSQETYEKVICFLAHKDEATQYEIANAETVKLSYAPVHQTIKKLLALGFLKETKQKQGKGPLPNRYFRLTFKGFITALALFSKLSEKIEDPKVMKNLRIAIIKHAKFYPEIKIFSEWNFLEKTFGNEAYTMLEIAALSWFNTFVSFNTELYPEKNEVVKEALKVMLEMERKKWKPCFVNLFFDTLFSALTNPLDYLSENTYKRVSKGTPSKELEAFIKETFEKRKAAITRKLNELNEKEKLLLAQFGVKSSLTHNRFTF